jgi:acyl-[acyl-carrier-protein]-phospholipid O-acyltransferase/long-chain-fatty-acid--[acyl-carrier-protein] ligase
MFQQLMTSRRFAPIFWCQLFSALNDNFLKNALVIIILYHTATGQSGALVTLAGGLLVAPFLVFSALGGELADKYDKAIVARRLKLAEVPIAGIAAVGFLLHSVPLLFLALTLFGVMAALFGPIKYGILPDHLATEELPAGNALVEGATFVAILAGTLAGGLAAADQGNAGLVAAIVLGMAALALVSAQAVPRTGNTSEIKISLNPISATANLLRDLKADPRLWMGGLIVSWFWLVGVVALSLLPTLTKEQIGGTPQVVTLGLVLFTLGIAAGSVAAAKASHLRPNLALVPIGAVLMGLFSLDLAWVASGLVPGAAEITPGELLATASGLRFALDLFALAAAGGLFIVPSFAAVQAWAPAQRRARVVAAVNVLNAAFMTAATAVVSALQYGGATAPLLLAGLGLSNLLVVGLILRAWGRQGVQDIASLIFRLVYRLEVNGLEHIPPAGERVVVAPNHVSLMDGPLMHAILPSHAAFGVDTTIAQAWWVKPFLKLINAHTMDPTRPMAARTLVNLVKQGETLVIFPEGRITVTGGLMKVYDGAAMIADRADAWVLPIRIDGLERSRPWSYLRLSQIRKTWFPKVRVTIHPPRKLQVPAELKGRARRRAASAALQDIMIETAVASARIDRTLFEALADAKGTRDTGKPIVSDALGTKLSYRKLILAAQVLGRKLEPMAPAGGAVGVMLPNSAGVAVTFFALQSIGRVPAMINYTAGPQNVLSACRAAKVEVMLTSRVFIEKARLGDLFERLSLGVKVVYLEDIRAEITFADKVAGLLLGSRPQVPRDCNDPAVILFTSGSEGAPKAVVLSHRNILANVAQSLTRIVANGEDTVFNALPLFHSFGLTVGLIMPLMAGAPVFLYPSPLHYRIVPELVYQTNATILFGTDTFLNGYARVAHPYDLHSVRLVLAGAEAVKPSTRDLYMAKFGVRILEGYGVTEAAPVLASNTPMANKPGTVGRLSPLMEVRLDPVDGIEDGGRLFVRGPNIMLGYYRVENPGVLEPPENGWHDTGDIVSIDSEGFVSLKGRAKRFAKVGGEMVSLAAVEALAVELWPKAVSVVAAIPDPRKGERLVLLTTQSDGTRDAFLRYARANGASELMVPSVVLNVPSVPLLGSGKPDYMAAQKLAEQLIASKAPADTAAA